MDLFDYMREQSGKKDEDEQAVVNPVVASLRACRTAGAFGQQQVCATKCEGNGEIGYGDR